MCTASETAFFTVYPRCHRCNLPRVSTPNREFLAEALRHPLDHTEFDWGKRYEGKVRDNYSTTDGRRLIIKAVNYDGAPHTLLTRLQGSGVPASATVKLVTLTAGLDEANSLAQPDKLRGLETTKPYARDMAFELPPYTVAVVEIRAN